MGKLQKQSQREKNRTSVYVINDQFEIIYSNDEIEGMIPEGKEDRHCYEILSNEHSQCRHCPLRRENNGESIVFNSQRDEFVKVNASSVDWPGGENVI